MSQPATINPRIVEGLYSEALVLSDEVRAAFALSARIEESAGAEDLRRVALSCEGLRTTTRMMHAVAWLLNHRAFFMGELSAIQLQRNGRLSPDLQGSDEANIALLSTDIRELIAATERFYARLMRLEKRWRQRDPGQMSAIASLRKRMGVRPRA